MGIERGKQGLPSTDVWEWHVELLQGGVLSVVKYFCAGKSCPGEGCWEIPARGQTWRFRGDSWSQEKELEIEKVARAFPGASGDAHGSEGRREGYVGSR